MMISQRIFKVHLSDDYFSQHFADRLPDDKVGQIIPAGSSLVYQYDLVAVEIIYKAGCRIDYQGCAAHDQKIRVSYGVDRAGDRGIVKAFLIKDHIRFYSPAAFIALRNIGSMHHVFKIEKFSALHAVVFSHCSMQLINIHAAGRLMQSVDILCDDGLQFSGLFKFGQFVMRRVRLYPFYKDLIPVELVKLFRLSHKESMA